MISNMAILNSSWPALFFPKYIIGLSFAIAHSYPCFHSYNQCIYNVIPESRRKRESKEMIYLAFFEFTSYIFVNFCVILVLTYHNYDQPGPLTNFSQLS